MHMLNIWNSLKFNDIVYKNIGNAVAIYLKRCYKDCYIIEGIGCEIFYALINKMDYSEFVDFIVREYNVDINEVKNDIHEFIEDLITENILYLNKKYTEEIKTASLLGNENITLVYDYYMKNKMPYKVFLETTYTCNLNCDHCYLSGATNNNFKPIEIVRIKEIIDELSEMGLVELILTGGEAGLYENLIELIEYSSSKNILVTLLSNGTLLTEKMIDQIIKAGIHDVRVSLYGFEKYHDNFVHRKGSFLSSVKTLSLFREKAGIGSASCIVTKENVNEVKELKNYLKQKGIPISYSPLIIPTIYGDKTPTKLRLQDIELENFIKDYNINIGGNKCTAGISRFRIMPNGNVNPCEMLRHIYLGNIYEKSFKEILSSDEEKEWIDTYNQEQDDKCKKCDYSKKCVNCKGLSYLENGVLNSSTKFACDIAKIQYKLCPPKKRGVEIL